MPLMACQTFDLRPSQMVFLPWMMMIMVMLLSTYHHFVTFTIEAAHELGVPNVLFWPASACCFLSIINFPALVEKGLTPLKGTINLCSFPSACIEVYLNINMALMNY